MGFSLQQFSALFKIRDAAGQPYVLIGAGIEIVRVIHGARDLEAQFAK
jgi:plasmid stabilization system protein ParE